MYGFWDADLSTPLDEIESFIKLLEDDNTIFVFGCRKKTKGSNIQRSLIRHFIGRIIAFIMSTFLQISIYDTQCGAKILKKEYVNTIFKKKFHTKWLFDIEIFLRLIKIKKNKKMHEKVLSEWIDVPGSKLSYFNTFEIINEIIKIFFYYKIKKFHNGSN